MSSGNDRQAEAISGWVNVWAGKRGLVSTAWRRWRASAPSGSHGEGQDRESGTTGAVEYVHRSWPARAGQLSAIRGVVRNWMVSLALDDEEVADLVLVVDEAAANAADTPATHARQLRATWCGLGSQRSSGEEPAIRLSTALFHPARRPTTSHATNNRANVTVSQRRQPASGRQF